VSVPTARKPPDPVGGYYAVGDDLIPNTKGILLLLYTQKEWTRKGFAGDTGMSRCREPEPVLAPRNKTGSPEFRGLITGRITQSLRLLSKLDKE
jgi:hypothetical protein